MNIKEAQKDMREAYLSGGSGVLISSLVWLTAAVSAIYSLKQISIIIFFVGGMFIHPVGILIDKLFGRTGKHKKENSLGTLAMESTIILFIGLFIVYSLFQSHPNWFFPVMLLIIGVRYLIFQTLYGMKIYWLLGGLLIVVGFLGISYTETFHIYGIIGGIIELIFSLIIVHIDRKNFKPS